MALQNTTALATITLQEASSTVTFSEIPNTYRDLVLLIHADGTAQTELYIRINGDTGATYTSVRMQGSGSTAGGATYSGTNGMRLNGNGDIMTNFSFNAVISFPDCSATDKHKTVLSRTNSSNGVDACAGRYPSTNAISSITAYPNSGSFDVGSTFALFGRIA